MRDPNETAGTTGDRRGPASASAPAANLITNIPAGTTVGRYVVLDHLGRGGMGVLYRAYDGTLMRTVALKFLRTDRGGDAQRRADDLLHEARTLGQLAHPNLLRVYDCGRFDEQVFMAMELMRCDLRSWLEEPNRNWREIVQLFCAAGEGLNHAHLRGRLHRDFKPANVLLDDENRPYVTDFGIAISSDERAVQTLASSDAAPANATLRRAAGTAGYMSPEQMRCENLTPQSDQFSFCAALYFALYGQLPFGELIIDPLPPLPNPPPRREVPKWLHDVVAKGLSARAADRHPSMDELIRALKDDPAVKRRARLTTAALALLLLAMAGVLTWLLTRESDAQRLARECRQRADSTWQQIFGPERAQKIQSAFVTANPKTGSADFDRVRKRFEPEANEWLAASKQACGHPDPTVKKHWQTCLEERRKSLQTISTLFATADASIEANALSTVLANVLPAASCGPGKAPTEAASASAVATDDPLDEELGKARLLLGAGKYDDAIEEAIYVDGMASDAHDDAVGAEANLLHGEILTELLRDGADKYLEKASQAGDRLGNDLLRVRVYLTFSEWLANRGRKLEANTWLQRAEAVLQRLGGNPLLLARVLTQRGRLYELKVPKTPEDSERAVTAFRQALDLLTQLLPPDHPAIAGAKNNLALSLPPEQGLPILEEVLHSREALYGPEHPEVATAWHNIGVNRGEAHDCARAKDAFERATKMREAQSFDVTRLGRTHAAFATALENCADEEHALEEQKKAREDLENGGAPDVEQVRELKKLKRLLKDTNSPWEERHKIHLRIGELSGGNEEDPDDD